MAVSSRIAVMSIGLVLINLIMLTSFSEAKDFLVGGKSDAWEIPSSPQSQPLNQWAQSSRFQIGDSLVWKYEAGKDSVLQVNRESYMNCNLTNPIAEYKDGNTKVELKKSGPYYFVSGAKGHCEKGQKLIVVVMAPRSASPAPSPAGFDGPAVAPTSGVNGGSSRLGLMGMMVVLGMVMMV
ncbi:Plastocyanin-like [Macleaya cordata]|uniref:Plastocyanin-like n=1 Tax=Macleaya cordata TaxID=56857 RepID=A0A200PSY8_MACCD|nr:Plastocyanin-like [Macleaya cordata]